MDLSELECKNSCCRPPTLQQKLISIALMSEKDEIDLSEIKYGRVDRQTIHRIAGNVISVLNNKQSFESKFKDRQQDIITLLKHIKKFFQIQCGRHGQMVKFTTTSKVVIYGDFHGQFNDLKQALSKHGRKEVVRVFLGDYVDRGHKQVETILYLLLKKLYFPKLYHLLRGNHETSALNWSYGFLESCTNYFGNKYGSIIWRKFNEIFNYLPRSALINKAIFCMHGGISPRMFDEQFCLDTLTSFKNDTAHDNIPTVLRDLYWADPAEGQSKFFLPNTSRNISYTFNEEAVEQFHAKFETKLIVRAHQAVKRGYEEFNENDTELPGLFTIFSAPNYYTGYGKAAIMEVEFNGKRSYDVKKIDQKFNLVKVDL